MSTMKFFANIFVAVVNFACMFCFLAFSTMGNIIGCLGILGVIGQVLFNLKDDNKYKKAAANILVALPVGICLFCLLAINLDGLIIGMIGLIGLAGLIMFNKAK